MSGDSRRNWRELAVLAATEEDPEKLLALVNELNAYWHRVSTLDIPEDLAQRGYFTEAELVARQA